MTKEKAQARREHLARMRDAQKRKERRTAMLMWGAGGLVVVLLVGLVGFYLVNERAQTSLDAVKSAKYQGGAHKETKVKYAEIPPMGGEHNSVWQRCGIYDQPVNNENAVHALEHGAVWITYRPDLPKGQVETLKKVASADYILLSPYPGLPSPVVLSSWNKQLPLENADDPRLPKFVSKFKNGPETPELGAACDGTNSTDKTAAESPIPDGAPTPDASPEPSSSPSPSSTS
ncbi:DUF3105 domain-containing protein [Streptosporangium roseum]|uniref:DUF3105 domain-containing protein n=1 Tax=Streptosporangium roseum (strain ATCC 12428 / DSM 43021 / JCM 3005 / KCTC 9067 / NCIMB 10171 / NRRL 2505 / NI 9100) TaxID=479432 RepID=D2B353_STRRD|nr:DUF3105 domain-containing protein [Streptosporangium roseum]ACZ85533.1 hypothetical protein Sros_2559 [Streptosporangium roseum DSM 43021]